MGQPSVSVIDYGMCNLLNVARAFEKCGARVTIVDDAKAAITSDRLVVPGVGAFSDSIYEVTQRGFDDAIRTFLRTGRPLYGICVGMQMLFDGSEEFGEHKGLGILPGRVQSVPTTATNMTALRVPHIGWNHLVRPIGGRNWNNSILEPFLGENPAVYFVHSFSAIPSDQSDKLADCVYGGHPICAAVQRENLVASQFHPERSGLVGLEIIRRFLKF